MVLDKIKQIKFMIIVQFEIANALRLCDIIKRQVSLDSTMFVYSSAQSPMGRTYPYACTVMMFMYM